MAQISYVLIVPIEEGRDTLFQGWQRGVASTEFIPLLISAVLAPIDTAEIFLSQEELISFRAGGARKNIIAIGSHLIDAIQELTHSDFVIVITPPAYLEKVKALDTHKGQSLLVASTRKSPGVINFSNVSPDNVRQLFDQAIYEEINRVLDGTGKQQDAPKQVRAEYLGSAKCAYYGSGATLANELLHLSLGLKFTSRNKIPSGNIQGFYDAIRDGVESILDFTNKKDITEAIIYSPSIMALYYNTNSNFWNQLFRKIKAPWQKEFIRNGLIKNPGYSGFSIPLGVDNIENLYNVPYAGAILRERQLELALTNYSVGLLATNECIPAIRVPNAVNLHQAELKELEFTHKRSDPKSLRQLQLKFKALTDSIKSDIGSQLTDLIVANFDSCKICSDAPLEWVYLGDLPLMISHEVSKIPMTPGNMLLQSAALGAPVTIPTKALHKILVIRSFANQDKIKKFLEIAIGCFQLNSEINVKFVDVTTITEVISALNNFEGTIVIFDCHGDHGGLTKPGWLQIGKEKLDSWQLSSKARVPPIVMLSACSTSAAGGSHASVANGFLRSGALSVIGTMLPVDAAKSSAFIARIIYRIDAFLPAIHKLGYNLISWRTLISLFFRMSYVTDVLGHFRDIDHIITLDQYTEIHSDASQRINLLDPSWYSTLLEQVSNASGIPAADLLSKIKDENPFLETMLYCQLGRPELLNIFLGSEEPQ